MVLRAENRKDIIYISQINMKFEALCFVLKVCFRGETGRYLRMWEQAETLSTPCLFELFQLFGKRTEFLTCIFEKKHEAILAEMKA